MIRGRLRNCKEEYIGSNLNVIIKIIWNTLYIMCKLIWHRLDHIDNSLQVVILYLLRDIIF